MNVFHMQTTNNTILNGKIILTQPSQGYRAAIDPIFLAASVPVHPLDSVLEVGAGVGTAMLALAHRIPQVKIIGLELQRSLVRLASHNIKLNGYQDRLDILNGNLLDPLPRIAAGSFSHVMANPPYFSEEKASQSPYRIKALSNSDHEGKLDQWIDFCYRMVRPKGSVTFIFTSDRLDELLSCMHGKLGEILIFPLWSKAGQPAKRIIVRGRKNIKAPCKILSGLVLHTLDGSYTKEANSILQDGKGLDLQ